MVTHLLSDALSLSPEVILPGDPHPNPLPLGEGTGPMSLTLCLVSAGCRSCAGCRVVQLMVQRLRGTVAQGRPGFGLIRVVYCLRYSSTRSVVQVAIPTPKK